MALTPEQDQAAFSKQYDEEQAAKAAQEAQAKLPPSPFSRYTMNVGRVSTQQIDAALSDEPIPPGQNQAVRKTQDVAAGAITGATNIADAGVSLAKENADDFGMGPINAALIHHLSPVWDYAKKAILDFRDAVQVKDPTLSDNLTQGVAQLAIPFAGYSKALAGLHGFAQIAAAGAITDATALQPHDMRMADLMSLGRHTEGKLGDVLRTLAPDGSALNAYINYLTDRTNETEAEGRFKNVIDGFGVNLIATPLLHAVASTLKQGTAGVRYAMENGVRSTVGDLFTMGPPAGSPAAQAGKIVFHGTPHDFPSTPDNPLGEFDLGKIGTGEGAQVRGHGAYFAESPDTAGSYQQKLWRRNVPKDSALYEAHSMVETMKGDTQAAYRVLKTYENDAQDALKRDFYGRAADLVKSGNVRKLGRMYHVDISDDVLGQMLNHDKPLSAQPDILHKIPKKDQRQLQQVLDDHGQDLTLDELTGDQFRQTVERAISENYLDHPPVNGVGGNAAEDASDYFRSHGIPGATFLDQGSRVKGEGTRNIVLFDTKHAKIVKKE